MYYDEISVIKCRLKSHKEHNICTNLLEEYGPTICLCHFLFVFHLQEHGCFCTLMFEDVVEDVYCLKTALVGRVERCPPLVSEIQGLSLAFLGHVTPVIVELVLQTQWLSCQVPGITGSLLGLVGPVSVYCDCVR